MRVCVCIANVECPKLYCSGWGLLHHFHATQPPTVQVVVQVFLKSITRKAYTTNTLQRSMHSWHGCPPTVQVVVQGVEVAAGVLL